ncbi:MAG: Dolichyl-phosphate beta-D-mannosyltransferase [Parcubacteria group bacterium GW2011_GWA2_47_7]|nr:MAG: Dolichyl-phosphate beta-D-mannosyltransferase [Parcubacteria group bacterium GW2011_GWA2_47_7]
MNTMPKSLVIIPTYNEEENILKLVEHLLSINLGLDVLVVDDGKDHTSALIADKQKLTPHLFLIKRETKSGRGTAVLEGIKFGIAKGYDLLVEMDADFSHDPIELPALLAVASPNRVVIGSRYLKESKIVNWPLRRRIFSRCANFYAGIILGIGITDYTNGYRVYARDAAEKIDFSHIKSTGYVVLSEIAYQLFRKGVEFREVPTIFVNRSRGVSNFSLKEIKEAFLSVIRIRFDY